MALSPSSTTAHKAMAAACRMVLCLDVHFAFNIESPLLASPPSTSSPMEAAVLPSHQCTPLDFVVGGMKAEKQWGWFT